MGMANGRFPGYGGGVLVGKEAQVLSACALCLLAMSLGSGLAYLLAVTMNIGPIRYTGRFSLMYFMQSITIVTSIRCLRGSPKV